MKQLSPYEVMQAEVNRIAKSVTDMENADFGQFFLGATAILASYGDQNQATNATLCAYAIRSMSEQERGDFMQSVELNGRVYQQIASPDPWPFAQDGNSDD